MIPDNYTMKTTFFMDFNIADKFGVDGIKSTYKRAFNEWKDDELYMRELTFVLNIKCWHFHHVGNAELSDLYSELYYDCYEKCLDHFKGDELRDYIDFLD